MGFAATLHITILLLKNMLFWIWCFTWFSQVIN
uniref:Uncharacterized protein n=1 Tax=Tetranychus urticae TaxID=32264 RepID=T1KYG7_TETUR